MPTIDWLCTGPYKTVYYILFHYVLSILCGDPRLPQSNADHHATYVHQFAKEAIFEIGQLRQVKIQQCLMFVVICNCQRFKKYQFCEV